jgi:hypothetical protein
MGTALDTLTAQAAGQSDLKKVGLWMQRGQYINIFSYLRRCVDMFSLCMSTPK